MHTGQHHDDSLSEVFFRELGLAAPGSRAGDRRGLEHLADSRGCCARWSRCWRSERPDAVLVYGDTNSTLAGALAAAQSGRAGGPRRGRDALASTARCPRSATACSPTTSRELLLCASRDRRREPARGVDRRARRGRRRRDGRRRAAPAARRARGHARAARPTACGPAPTCCSPRTAPGNVDDRRAPACAGGAGASRCPSRSSSRCTRAPVRACATRGCSEELAALEGLHICEPLGYVEFSGAAVPRPRGADRLRGRPEGGVPCRRCPASRCEPPPSGSRPWRAGLEHARGPRPRRRARRARTRSPPRRDRSCTETGTRPSAACGRSVPSPRDDPLETAPLPTVGGHARPTAQAAGAQVAHVDDPPNE